MVNTTDFGKCGKESMQLYSMGYTVIVSESSSQSTDFSFILGLLKKVA